MICPRELFLADLLCELAFFFQDWEWTIPNPTLKKATPLTAVAQITIIQIYRNYTRFNFCMCGGPGKGIGLGLDFFISSSVDTSNSS